MTPMTRINDIRSYMLAGQATFTLVSKKSGARFTYRVRKSDTPKLWFVDTLTGPDNEVDFTFVGTLRGIVYGKKSGLDFRRSAKSSFSEGSSSVVAIGYFVARLNYSRDLDPEKLEFWHAGKCARCGRKLTDPDSIATGLGPICREKSHA
jgi:hypothetical protein